MALAGADEGVVELAEAALGGALIGLDVGGGVEEITGEAAGGEGHIDIILTGHGKLTALDGLVRFAYGNLEVLTGHAALVVVHELENNAVAGTHGGFGDADGGGGAFEYHGGLVRLKVGTGDGQHAVGIAHGQQTEPAATDLGVHDLGAALIHHATEHQGIAGDVHVAALKAHMVSADAEGAITVASGAGQGQTGVLYGHIVVFVGAVDGQNAPAVADEVAVVIDYGAVVAELAEPVGAQEAAGPAEIAQPVGVGGGVLNPGILNGHMAVAADMNRTAGHAVDGEITAVNGHIGGVDGSHGGTHAHKVVGAEAVQFHAAVLHQIGLIAGDENAVEALCIGGKIDALGLFTGDGAILNQCGHAFFFDHLAAVDDHGVGELPGDVVQPHQCMGGHVIGFCHGEHDVAMVAAGLGIIADAVYGHGDEFPLGGL